MAAPVVDAQVHVWLPEAPDRPWPPGGAERAKAMHRAEPISGSGLLAEMRAVGVDRAVLVPPFFEGYRNDHAVACATEAPDAFRVMARVDLRTGDAGPVRELLRDPVVAGVRLVFLPADAGRVDDPGAEWFWEFAEQEDVPVMLLASGQLDALGELARRRPGLRLAVDHLGLTGERTDAAAAPEIATLAGLATLPNVSVKLTAAPCYSTEPYPYPALHPLLRQLYDAYGPERLFWGSDLSRLRGSYADLVRLFREDLDFLSPADVEAVMGGSVLAWLRWPA
ncbi:amidohydrolase [Geodermatophilus sp. YIM 151500]|uniref:amidohydrolase family protein n=1 Tax=Geodermatophilus sp. YIM 151500 TaxID=2984531 RepID=UPI0021E42703|nr:amidohydrolase family protein [Geodermatophilus sp. YIM 151500]MCV2488868.1 amidohydrolase [Geodermatophilus sp. YIM 151500]